MKTNTTLESSKIVDTVEQLGRRINERFPDSGLHKVSQTLLMISKSTERDANAIDRPIYPIRVVCTVLIALLIVSLIAAMWLLGKDLLLNANLDSSVLIPLIEAGTNEIVLLGVVVFFLVNLERRMKRIKALKAIHELRAIAHVIDMHQLTKDPVIYSEAYVGTVSSPRRQLTQSDLIRYLDYCTELLSLTGKLSALYIQRFDDSVTLTAANDVENLSAQLSGKIWQKMIIVYDSKVR